MEIQGTADEPRRTRSSARGLNGPDRSFEDGGVRRKAKIIVGGKVQEQASIGRDNGARPISGTMRTKLASKLGSGESVEVTAKD